MGNIHVIQRLVSKTWYGQQGENGRMLAGCLPVCSECKMDQCQITTIFGLLGLEFCTILAAMFLLLISELSILQSICSSLTHSEIQNLEHRLSMRLLSCQSRPPSGSWVSFMWLQPPGNRRSCARSLTAFGHQRTLQPVWCRSCRGPMRPLKRLQSLKLGSTQGVLLLKQQQLQGITQNNPKQTMLTAFKISSTNPLGILIEITLFEQGMIIGPCFFPTTWHLSGCLFF